MRLFGINLADLVSTRPLPPHGSNASGNAIAATSLGRLPTAPPQGGLTRDQPRGADLNLVKVEINLTR
jgi:hypothetical protein